MQHGGGNGSGNGSATTCCPCASLQVAEHVRRAAEELSAAAEEIPGCDCAVLDSERMAKVVGDLARAELAAQAVHSGLRGLERKHDGTAVGLATLATQPLDGIVNSPVRAQAAEAISR